MNQDILCRDQWQLVVANITSEIQDKTLKNNAINKKSGKIKLSQTCQL